MTDYAHGFKDGFAAGLEEGKKLIEEQWRQEKIKELEKSLPQPTRWPYTSPGIAFDVKETCPKCGMKLTSPMGYVCSSPNCPTFSQVTCGTPVRGAVGVEVHDGYWPAQGPNSGEYVYGPGPRAGC